MYLATCGKMVRPQYWKPLYMSNCRVAGDGLYDNQESDVTHQWGRIDRDPVETHTGTVE